MSPIPLTYPQVLAAARLAYDEQRLSAQGPTPACLYEDKSGHPCAVGAALKPGAVDPDDQGESVLTLTTRGVFAISAEDLPKIRVLQSGHDKWATRTGTEADFRTLIGHSPTTTETTQDEARPD